MTVLYSILHFLVDGVCALAMFGAFEASDSWYFYILLYNFCAFALQMPFGAALDILGARRKGLQPYYACLAAVAGVLCTLAGAVTHPAVLGIGNALFHVGGGVGTIWEDHAKSWHGAGLGVFVAPGALGLYLGTWIARNAGWRTGFWGAGILMAVLCLGMACVRRGGGERARKSADSLEQLCEKRQEQIDGGGRKRFIRFLEGDLEPSGNGNGEQTDRGNRELFGREQFGKARSGRENQNRFIPEKIVLAVCCLWVVILRSYIGMAVQFPWKTGLAAGVLGVLALVGGKVAGGFLAARHGALKTTVFSLGLAALCYLASVCMPFGLAALFFFNMTMPITLYWMVCAFPRMPGFAFGLLTFGLFLGFLPGYLGMLPGGGGNVLGCAGAFVSLLLLAIGGGRRMHWEDI